MTRGRVLTPCSEDAAACYLMDMKFIIDAEPFQRMLEMLAQAHPDRRRRFAPLHIEASRDRLRVQQEDLTAEIEVIIWQEGRCVVPAHCLKQSVTAELNESTMVVTLEEDFLKVGASRVPCIADCPPLSRRQPSRIFFASVLGVVPSGSAGFNAVA